MSHAGEMEIIEQLTTLTRKLADTIETMTKNMLAMNERLNRLEQTVRDTAHTHASKNPFC